MRLSILAAAALAAAGSASAQTPAAKPADRAPSQVTGPNVDVIKEAVNTLKQGGDCMVEFTVGVDGKAKDLKPTCTPEAYAPYVLRAMETVEYLPEIFDGEVFETEGLKQPFKFGTGAAAQPSNVRQPVVIKNIEPKDISRAINKVDEAGSCNVAYVVGADGKPKDIEPNCTPVAYNPLIIAAFDKMTYEPAQQDGKAVDWKMTMPINLTKPD